MLKMLRVESNTDIKGFTEFEEDILFDEDDPDFDHEIPMPLIYKGRNNPNVHKWMAIVTDAKNGLDGTNSRVRGYGVVKSHMLRAVELNPNDVVVLYMLGKMCYVMSQLTWFQRLVAWIFYSAAPLSTYREAYEYFMRAEEIEPRFYVPNLYMLGKTCFKMEMFYRARYYLDLASSLPARTDYEKRCSARAKGLSECLASYDLQKEALEALRGKLDEV